MNEYLEVRCCCLPDKLLGWLPVSSSDFQCSYGTFEIPTLAPLNYDSTAKLSTKLFKTITLPISTIQLKNKGRYTAYKSDNHPPEVLKQIPGFISAK